MAARVRDAAASRERVHRAATTLFAERGYHGTGIQDVAVAAGLGRGALYYHIKSKQDLLLQVIREPLQEMVEYARDALSTAGDPETRLRTLARIHLENLVRYREAWEVTVRDSGALSAEAATEIRALRHEYESAWQELFVECSQAGVLEPVDQVRLRGILGMFNHTYPWLRSRGPFSAEPVATSLLDLLFDGLRPAPPTEGTR